MVEARLEIPCENEYGVHFYKALRSKAMSKLGLIGSPWKVSNIDFDFMEGCPNDSCDDEHWNNVSVKMQNGDQVHTVRLHREEVEYCIDKMKLSTWKTGAAEW